MDTATFIYSTAARLDLNADRVATCVRSACGGHLPETLTEDQERCSRDEILDEMDGFGQPEPVQCSGCGQYRELIRGRRVCTECI
jgi:hypothetical protein